MMDRRGFLRLLGIGVPATLVAPMLPAGTAGAPLIVTITAQTVSFNRDLFKALYSVEITRDMWDNDTEGVIKLARR